MSSLVGHQIQQSEKVNSLIKDLVGEVTKLNSSLEGIRAPQDANKEAGKQKIEQTGLLRGRPLHYQYMGSGAGRGPYVELEDGSVKLDLINGIGIHLMGHAHPRVMTAAVRGSLADILNQGNLQPNNEYRLFTEKLVQIASKNSRLKYAWIATCGTMANENAVKISRQKNSPARFIMSFKDAFAGRSTMMAEVTDNPAYKQGLPEYHEVLRVPFYDKRDPKSGEKALAAMKEHVAKHEGNICAFGFEPMLGEGGYQAAPREFFVPLLEYCKSKNIAVWADEVQTFTRTGEYFAFETLGLGQYIDICTIAKTAQIGATLYTEEYNPKPGLIAGTFSGASPCLAAGVEMLNMLSEGFLGPQGRIQQIHKRFIDGINKMNDTTCKGIATDAGGMGLMVAFTPHDGKKDNVNAFLNKLYANGVIAFPCGKDPVRARFLIPAIIQDQDIDIALKVIEKTLLEGV
ncbi:MULTISPECIES: aminotransferase class III-fold pyridoxal phosphate-dependent enzyme [unclassified Bdellovibrio]|uniref:aminotransferase class III-fold pyridoxal phosphate-dependent enzyme n=1 Tax=unclassified Bdellovibrio TaxID=2633795 RepID=UPI0011583F29|nr:MULTISPECIES: aminotransferase class III-fold pyridoxal phosphate-dependent enzyme [unclassified Bdellovibrio]QDK43783.1 acetylornithine aminotransferase [Bdellovibrio sp. ZAP7]QLY25604.1 aminotransferase class III-fold pyridoxal phosphate-dependent enzyme [Bdellovibrio sp. KM01]